MKRSKRLQQEDAYRVKELVEEITKHTSIKKLEKACGLINGYLNAFIAGRVYHETPRVLIALLEAYSSSSTLIDIKLKAKSIFDTENIKHAIDEKPK